MHGALAQAGALTEEQFMQQLVYHVATTLDGYIARPDGSAPGFPTSGDHVEAYQAELARYAAIVMGRPPTKSAMTTA